MNPQHYVFATALASTVLCGCSGNTPTRSAPLATPPSSPSAGVAEQAGPVNSPSGAISEPDGTKDANAMATDLEPGIRLEADGRPIDVDVGHAAPWYADVDADGVRDLLVGQFGGGKLRVYHNSGSDVVPEFGEYYFLQAEGKDATVPFF